MIPSLLLRTVPYSLLSFLPTPCSLLPTLVYSTATFRTGTNNARARVFPRLHVCAQAVLMAIAALEPLVAASAPHELATSFKDISRALLASHLIPATSAASATPV